MDRVEIKEAVDKAIHNYLYEKEPAVLYEAVRYLPAAGGKRLRPIIACLAAESVGGIVERAIPFAVSLEIVHTFTLIHDDIMDKDEERRGLKSVHKLFGESTAILAGDTLFAKAFEIASYTRNPTIAKDIMRYIAIMSKEICEGQQLDISYEGSNDISEYQFFEVIEKKTARMFEYACFGGALIGGGTEEQQNALRQYGKNLGIAFQIWDDCLDIIGKDIGKPVGSDISEGKKTLLYIYALKNASNTDWLKIYGNKKATRKEIETVIDIFKQSGAIDYAINKATELTNDAKDMLKLLPESHAKQELLNIADFAIKRQK